MTPARHIPASRRQRSRGAALLLVITSIAVITALAVDLAYNTRVSVQLAANARDELRAECLAKSALGMARLILHFQQSIDGGMAGVAAAGRATLPGLPGGGLAGLSLSIRLWEILPVTSRAMGFLGGTVGPSATDSAFPAFGGFEGTFDARVDDEDRKINVRQLDGVRPFQGVQAARLVELMRDPRWDFLFDRDDANGLRVSRKDLLAALKDWIDIDETNSIFTGAPFQPFEKGFADENALYDRLDDRYKAKNAPFDSQEELYLVAGVGDAFLAAFGDRLTVYPDVSATINVNTDDRSELLINAVAMGGGLLQPVFLDPTFLDRLQAALRLARPLPFLALSAVQFAQVLQALGVQVAPEVLAAANAGVSSAYGDRSSTFRIRATGSVGPVRRSVEAVVIFDPQRALGLQADLGRLIHWHEE
jgi:general secretion pathway protein K